MNQLFYRATITSLIILSIGLLVYLLSPILLPFILSFVLAYIGNPLVRRLEMWGISRTVAVLIGFLVLLVLALAMALGVLPLLQKQLVGFGDKLPNYMDWLLNQGVPWLQTILGVDLSALDLTSIKKMLLAEWRDVGSWLGRALSKVSRSGLGVLAWMVNLVLIPLITFYLLRDWDDFLIKLEQLLPVKTKKDWTLFARETDSVLSSFLRGQLSVMAILALVYSVGLSIVGLNLAIPLGLLAGAISFVPYLGFVVGILSAGIAALFQFQDMTMLLWVAAVFIFGQGLEGFVLTPKIIGDRLGLHPVAVIFSVMAGGQLFGFVGVLLALPVAAVSVVAVGHLRSHIAGQNKKLHAKRSGQPRRKPRARQSG